MTTEPRQRDEEGRGNPVNQKTAINPRQFLSEDRAREFETTFAATIKLDGLVKDCTYAGDTDGAAYYRKLSSRFAQTEKFKLTEDELEKLHQLQGEEAA